MSQLGALLWSKRRIARHSLAAIREQSKLKVGFVGVSSLLLLIGIYGASRLVFFLLESLGSEALGGAQLSLGDLVMSRLLSTFALTVFVLLIFSNVLVCYASLFRSREMTMLVHSPLPVSTLFLGRFVECVSFSSWATAFLGAPMLLAYGLESGAPPAFYLSLVLFYVPFVVIPAAIGAVLSLLIVRLVAALRVRLLPLAAGAAAIVSALYLALRGRLKAPDLSEPSGVQAILDVLAGSQNPFLPSQWLAQGVLAAATGDLGEAAFQLFLLTANAALALFIATLLAERLFYGAWSSLLASDAQKPAAASAGGSARVLETLLRPLPEPARSLTVKDIRSFWREPSQWSQFVLFFGILAVYLANLGGDRRVALDPETWQAWGTLLNLGAALLILASLTTRFVYPLISLEGRRIWILGMAPLTRRGLVWQKFWLSVVTTSLFTVGLSVLSASKLELGPLAFALSVAAVLAATIALSGLAVGLGSLYPDFADDNPARIVSGLGGTLNFLLSMVYVTLLAAALGVVLLWHRLSAQLGEDSFPQVLAGAILWILVLTAVTCWLPMRLGIRNLERLEI
ncbi:MAG: hypothetical protein AAF725_00480 [Acidobacteriota bacterium]